jgi:RimJ/RimL family protein N-acetyltransferase
MELVRAIMTEPEIWDRASEDGIDQETWYPGTDGFSIWLLCVEDNTPIGVILLHTDNSTTLKMHPYLRKAHRTRGRDMMKEFYEWVLENTEDRINKINVSIPENDKRVINFAKKVGFKKEGLNRDSYMKNGTIYAQQNLGITRSEIEDYING